MTNARYNVCTEAHYLLSSNSKYLDPPSDGGTSTSETSVSFHQTTWSNNPEESQLHTRRRENLKSQNISHDLLSIKTITALAGAADI
jgi:hypothetical protein